MPKIIPFEQSKYRAMCSVKTSCEVIRNPTAITATATYLLHMRSGMFAGSLVEKVTAGEGPSLAEATVAARRT